MIPVANVIMSLDLPEPHARSTDECLVVLDAGSSGRHRIIAARQSRVMEFVEQEPTSLAESAGRMLLITRSGDTEAAR